MGRTGDVDESVRAVIRAELETLSPACRRDPSRLDTFLADDFHEFGRSGGEIVKEGTAVRVASLASRDDTPIEAIDMRGQVLAPGVVMLKYTSTHRGIRTNRTSLWRLGPDGNWQMFHHQGTPVP